MSTMAMCVFCFPRLVVPFSSVSLCFADRGYLFLFTCVFFAARHDAEEEAADHTHSLCSFLHSFFFLSAARCILLQPYCLPSPACSFAPAWRRLTLSAYTPPPARVRAQFACTPGALVFECSLSFHPIMRAPI